MACGSAGGGWGKNTRQSLGKGKGEHWTGPRRMQRKALHDDAGGEESVAENTAQCVTVQRSKLDYSLEYWILL